MTKNKINEKALCQAYLKEYPIAHVIPRVSECLILSQFEIRTPVLDLGCGDGIFTRICFGKKRIAVGLDPDPRVIKRARKSGVYQKTVVAGAEKMPFEDNYFATVISNSVLEHITDLDKVFDETSRVLKKGGKFIFTVPDITASDYFFYAWLLKQIKSQSLTRKYVKLKNKLYHYAHLEDRKYWEQLGKKSGFKINNVVGLNSSRAVKWIDFFFPLALLDYFSRKLFYRGFVFRPDFIAKKITPYILKLTNQVSASEATGWCFELEKE